MRMELHDKGLVFFLQLLLLEKQKKKFKKVYRSCCFLI